MLVCDARQRLIVFLSSNTQDFIEVWIFSRIYDAWYDEFLSSNTQDFIEVNTLGTNHRRR